MTESKRAKMLERVAKLMAHAEGTENEDERDAFIAKADALMLAYAIETWELEKVGKQKSAEPVAERITGLIDGASAIRDELTDLVMTVCRHVRVKPVFHNLDVPKKHGYPIGVTFIGFEEDVEYAQMLFTTLHLELARQIHPHADPDADVDANLIRLKEAGMKWEDIHNELAKAGFEPYAVEPHIYAHAVKMSKRYANLCLHQGRPQLKVNPVTYQRNFAAGFQREIARRLRELRDRQRVERDDAGTGESTALVLRDRNALVAAKQKEVFPKMRTISSPDASVHLGARAAGKAAGAKADLGAKRMGARKAIR